MVGNQGSRAAHAGRDVRKPGKCGPRRTSGAAAREMTGHSEPKRFRGADPRAEADLRVGVSCRCLRIGLCDNAAST